MEQDKLHINYEDLKRFLENLRSNELQQLKGKIDKSIEDIYEAINSSGLSLAVDTLPEASIDTLGSIYVDLTKDSYITINTGTPDSPEYLWLKLGNSYADDKELKVTIYLKGSGIPDNLPYAMSSDNYEQNGFWAIPLVNSESEIDEWFSAPNKKITYNLDSSASKMLFGGIFGADEDLFPYNFIFSSEHSMIMEDSSENASKSIYTTVHLDISWLKLSTTLQVTKYDSESDKYGFSFDLIPGTPAHIVAKINEENELGNVMYDCTISPELTLEYINTYISKGGSQILVTIKNENNIEISNNVVNAINQYMGLGDYTALISTFPALTDGKIIVCTVFNNGGCSYSEVKNYYTMSEIDNKLEESKKIIGSPEIPTTYKQLTYDLYLEQYLENNGQLNWLNYYIKDGDKFEALSTEAGQIQNSLYQLDSANYSDSPLYIIDELGTEATGLYKSVQTITKIVESEFTTENTEDTTEYEDIF